MKNKTLTLLLLSMLIMPLTSCDEESNNELTSEIDSSSNEEIESKDELEILYNKNKDVLDEYYFKYHSSYNKGLFGDADLAKKYIKGVNAEFFNYEVAFLGIITIINEYDTIIASCKTEEQAIEYQNFLNNQFADGLYLRHNNLVYVDAQLSYLFLYGAPLEKDGFLYYELDNGDTLLFGDVCNCESGIRNQDTVTEIPDWVDIIGGCYREGVWDDHNPNAELLIIPNSVKEIKPLAFAYSDYKNVSLSNGLKMIGPSAFLHMFNLDHIIIPISVEYIGKFAFSYGNIFCEAKSKPSGWDDNFAYNEAKVYYADEWEYDENGVPQIK